MSLTIWKAVLEFEGEQVIEVPKGADLLCARGQYDKIAVWFRCDPGAPNENRTILICGTGHPTAPLPSCSRYLGTAALDGGQLMFHIFDITNY